MALPKSFLDPALLLAYYQLSFDSQENCFCVWIDGEEERREGEIHICGKEDIYIYICYIYIYIYTYFNNWLRHESDYALVIVSFEEKNHCFFQFVALVNSYRGVAKIDVGWFWGRFSNDSFIICLFWTKYFYRKST